MGRESSVLFTASEGVSNDGVEAVRVLCFDCNILRTSILCWLTGDHRKPLMALARELLNEGRPRR